jgi:hypothetical protein
MITLRELSSWERRLGDVVRSRRGEPDELERELVRLGVYAEYSAVFRSYVQYVQLASDAEDPQVRAHGLEALKRAVFLVWYSALAPSVQTGVAELPEFDVRLTLEELDACCRMEPLDGELRFMVPWYVQQAPLAILRYPGLSVVRQVAESAGDQGAALPGSPSQFDDRGLMGDYWKAVLKQQTEVA